MTLAVMAGNLMTGLFFFACYKLSRAYQDEDVTMGVAACFLIPCAVWGVGFWLYG